MAVSDHTWKCKGYVTRIIDGDTFSADFDLGWGVWLKETLGRPNRVRLLNYSTPERYQEGGPEAKKALEDVLMVFPHVWVESQSLDSFGRTLGNVFTLDGQDILELLPQQWRH